MLNPAFSISQEVNAFIEQRKNTKKPTTKNSGLLKRNSMGVDTQDGGTKQPIETVADIVESLRAEQQNIKELKDA
jgi:hypothetical protein|tara:strand:- start:610 stop:834 length:225 start_codon:yes stop_codon:yes gene_type:complete